MNTFVTLVKTQLNLNFGISALKYRFTREKKKRWEPILIAFAILVGAAPLLALYSFLMFSIFMGGLSLEQPQPEMVLTVAFLFAQVLVLIFGMFYLMGSFYFSQDMNILVPMPLKPYEVLGSKFTVIMVNELITVLPILIPPMIIYGVGTGQGLVYWLKSLLLLVTAPVIPLVLGSVFIVLLMRVVNVRRYKDLLAIIGGIFGLLLALGFNLFFQQIPQNGGEEYLNNLIRSKAGLVNELGQKFPPSLWATFGLSDNGARGWGYFLLFLAVAIGLFAVLLWLANRVFYRGLLAGQEVVRKRKVLTREDMEKRYGKASGAVKAIFNREWKLLLRTPVYVINGLAGSLIGPIIIVFAFMTKGVSQDPEMKAITDAIQNPEYSLYVVLGGLGLAAFTAGMNLVASTSVSREGSCFWISRLIPVAPRQQVLAKLLQSYSVSVLSVVVTAAVMAAGLQFSFTSVAIILILGCLAAIPMVVLNLMLDVFRPRLVWNSPQEAMKQNMNGMLGMLISLLIIGILAGVTVGLLLIGAPSLVVYVSIGAVSAIVGVLTLSALFALADKKYKEYEI